MPALIFGKQPDTLTLENYTIILPTIDSNPEKGNVMHIRNIDETNHIIYFEWSSKNEVTETTFQDVEIKNRLDVGDDDNIPGKFREIPYPPHPNSRPTYEYETSNFHGAYINMLNNQALFPSENSVHYIRSILEEAEWKIKKIGMVSDLSSPDLKYLPYDLEDINDIPQYKCRRDNKSNKVLYQNVKTKEYYYLKTGLANRPLWICE